MKTKRSFFVRASKADPSGGITSSLSALKSILAGYGIRVSRDKLKQAASQYEEFDPASDFTSISADAALLQLVQEIGLSVRATMMPADYVVKGLTLPAMVLVGSPEDKRAEALTTSEPRWLLIWNRIGSFIQVMDPKRGQRHWYSEQALVAKLRGEPITFGADEWLAEASSELFTASLENWLVKLGLQEGEAEALIAEASSHEPAWQGLATLGAATRMIDSMRQAGGFRRGNETRAALLLLFKQALKDTSPAKSEKKRPTDGEPTQSATIPSEHWFVNPISTESPDEATLLTIEAVSLIQVMGLKEEARSNSFSRSARKERAPEEKSEEKPEKHLPRHETTSEKNPTIIDFLREDGLLTPSILGVSALLAGGAVVLQTVLFRGFIELSPFLLSSEQRLRALGVLFTFAFILFVLELPLDNTLSRIGRRLDARLRIAVLSVLPELASQYFQKFSTGELTERIHSVRALHIAPGHGSRMIRLSFQIIITVFSVALIDLASAPLALLNALSALIVGIFGFSTFMRLNMELRGEVGFLSRFYLDSLLGLVAIRTHGAERAVQREYESFVVDWTFVKWALQRAEFWMVVAYELLTRGFTVLLVLSYLLRGGEPANLLLLFYWTQNITSLGQQFMIAFQGFFYFNTVSTRFLKILSAPRERDFYPPPPSPPSVPPNFGGEATHPLAEGGIEITLKELSVEAAEQIILRGVTLTIEAGSQVAIVGPSGAGKSTLVGLLTGRYSTATGEVLIDNEPLSYERMLKLRQEMAWIDPSVQLWNRTLLQNLRYGTLQGRSDSPLERVIEQADLLNVLGRLPDGLQTMLGGGGRLVSGGQGQRIRLGRAMLRDKARLVILDEPFRGLDREKRHKLLTQTRKFWPEATLICVTHDVGETLTFERVLVVESGKIVEDDVPTVLAAKPDSRYRALLDAEEVVRQKLWSGENWRRLWLEDGQLGEK
jgi:ATP-binding cassette subfamily B protein